MSGSYRLVQAVIVRDMPDDGAVGLVRAPKNLVVERLDSIWWSGSWMRIVADVAGSGLYEGYVPAEAAIEDDGAPLHDDDEAVQTKPTSPPAHEGPREPFDRSQDEALPLICITEADYFHDSEGRRRNFGAELDDAKRKDAETVIERINALMERASADGIRFRRSRKTGSAVSSGWRPAQINTNTKGAAPRSNHIICRACDLFDPTGEIDRWCLDHPEILAEIGLWQEHPYYTLNWCHLQVTPPASGLRVFRPGAAPPQNPDRAFEPPT